MTNLVGLKGRQEGKKDGREMAALNAGRGLELVPLIEGDEDGPRGVAVKCIDITKTPDCEGSLPDR